MSALRKICVGAMLLLSAQAMLSTVAAQDYISLHPKKKPSFTIGFQAGREYFLRPQKLKINKHYSEVTNSVVFTKSLTKHIKLETGLTYNTIQYNTEIKGLDKKTFINAKRNTVSVPATLQVYFVPARCRVQPYCGIGVQYNLGDQVNPPFHKELYPANIKGMRYISLMMTQGITFQINTRIQINQSIHFIPGDTCIGINVGVGFNLK